jgi:hypothetical protein
MPRIPEETIERLKQEVSLERLATARGVKLARHGADLKRLESIFLNPRSGTPTTSG